MKPIVTLKQIQKHWNLPELATLTNEDLCFALLSDDFNGKLANRGCTIQNLGKSTVGKFVNGNFRSKASRAFANVDTTKRMLRQLRLDEQIPYRPNLELPPKTCRESMLCNIRFWVDQTRPAMTGSHPLFTELALIDESVLTEGELAQFQALQAAITRLRSDNTPESLTYALFLLVLTAVFREKMAEIPQLYDPEEIRAALAPKVCPDEPLTDGQVPFTDPDYMHNYWVYLFRVGYNWLYTRAHLRMTLSPEGDPQAELNLYDDKGSAGGNRGPIDRRFTGTPYRSAHDKTVYVVMRDQNDTLGILFFQHEKFNFGSMYFRSGLFLSTASGSHVPMVQKVAISSRMLKPQELPYAEGFLKTGGTCITLTDQQLRSFREAFRGYPWMEEFERSLLPFIHGHACTCYRFDEAEILSYSLTELDEQDRLRIMLALKSLSEPNRKETRNSVDCVPPPDLHKLFR